MFTRDSVLKSCGSLILLAILSAGCSSEAPVGDESTTTSDDASSGPATRNVNVRFSEIHYHAPTNKEEDEFIDKDLSMKDYLSEIIASFKEISQKKFIFNHDQFSNLKKITKSIEIVYGLRNFIGNANKFSKNTVYINLKSDSEITEVIIEDDGNGYPRDVLSKIGEPYLSTNYPQEKSQTGLGLGLFIGKTLLEKNFASINCRNSKTRSGAEVIVRWNNRDLFNI